MVVSLKTDLRFPIPGQQGHGSRIIQLRICNRIDPRGVMIRNGTIVFATGKRIDGYTAHKFYEAFVGTMVSINREVLEELIQHLQKDAMYYRATYGTIMYDFDLQTLIKKMYFRYQMLYQNTKYRGIRIITTFIRPVNEYFTIPFVFDIEECWSHEFFNLDIQNYWNYLICMCNGGSIQKMYEDRRCAARCNVAVEAKERPIERRSATASKPCNHLLSPRNQAPTIEIKDKRNTPISNRRIEM